MSEQNDSFGFGDAFSGLLSGYLAREDRKAAEAAASEAASQHMMITAPTGVTQRPNATPSNPSRPSEVVAGSGTATAGTIQIGGVPVNSTALYVGLGFLGVALVLKMVK